MSALLCAAFDSSFFSFMVAAHLGIFTVGFAAADACTSAICLSCYGVFVEDYGRGFSPIIPRYYHCTLQTSGADLFDFAGFCR